MNHAGRLRIACVCAFTQWALGLAIQIGNCFGYLLPPKHDWKAIAGILLAIPVIQTQNALVAAIFGVVAYFAAWNRITAWLFFCVYCAESAYLLVDQVNYKVFLDHIRLGAFERGQQFNLGLFVSSFLKELDWIFYCTLAVALLGALWLARTMLLKSPQPSHPMKLRWALVAAGLLAVIGLPAYSSKEYGHVNENAVVGLVHELTQQSLASSLAGRGAARHLLASYQSDQPADNDPRLAALLAAANPRATRPNIVLIVLESVGAVNILGADGLPRAALAPNLAILAQNGIVFNSIYTTFPGTTRSLISLHTGGRQPTYGGMADLGNGYQGAVLPKTIGDLGYGTAYFSSERMDGEGTDIFLKETGFHSYYDFSQDPKARDSRYQIHSWGAREEYTMSLMQRWIADQPEGNPFLLEYMTTATHHPYGAPADYRAPFDQQEHNSDYMNALYYTDRAIGTLADFLQKRGQLKDTIIVVTGDHGEAFGDRHANNFLHKNFTYDENVREFLMIFDGQLASRKLIDKPVISSRVGTNGDLMATLLALIGAPASDIPGRNLLAESFEARPVFFHKLASPETWGLRDGRWKYIGDIRSGAAELYDLSVDPGERKNLASAQPAKVALYRDLSQEWFLASEREFILRVKDYNNTMIDSNLSAGDTQIGARVLTVGSWRQLTTCAGNAATKATTGGPCQGFFTPETVMNPQEHVVAWTKWALDPELTARYEWISPSGKRSVSWPVALEEWHVTGGTYPGALPLEKGEWSVRLHEDSGVRLTARFTVQ